MQGIIYCMEWYPRIPGLVGGTPALLRGPWAVPSKWIHLGYWPYPSDKSRIAQFDALNFWEMVIARYRNVLLRRQSVVMTRLQN